MNKQHYQNYTNINNTTRRIRIYSTSTIVVQCQHYSQLINTVYSLHILQQHYSILYIVANETTGWTTRDPRPTRASTRYTGSTTRVVVCEQTDYIISTRIYTVLIMRVRNRLKWPDRAPNNTHGTVFLCGTQVRVRNRLDSTGHNGDRLRTIQKDHVLFGALSGHFRFSF